MAESAQTGKRHEPIRILATRVGIGVVIVVVLTLAAWKYDEQRKLRQLQAGAAQIQLAIEKFAVDIQGAYPTDLNILIKRGYLKQWPQNPYAPGPMKLLRPDEPWQPGGFTYVGAGPIVKASGAHGTLKYPPNFPWWLPGVTHADGVFYTGEIDDYLLVAYGPKSAKNLLRKRKDFLAQGGQHAVVDDYFDPRWDFNYISAPIDWSHADIVLSGGEDHTFID